MPRGAPIPLGAAAPTYRRGKETTDESAEVAFDAESLRALVSASSAALAEMDARCEREEAERADHESVVPAECSA